VRPPQTHEASSRVRAGDRRGAPPPSPSATRSKVILLAGLTVVVVVIAVAAFVFSQGSTGGKSTATPSATTAPLPTLPPSALTTYRDDEAGFTIKYPAAWKRLTPPVRELRLVVSPGGQESALVRVQMTEQATTPENLGNIKATTDGIVGSNKTAKVLRQNAISVNGMIGYYYLYTFTDEKSGLTGAHAHYFLFQGHKMNSIVLQAIPADNFKNLEGVFTQMLDSFHSDPEPATPSTAPPAPPTTVR
jgi:hypothetical protein